MRVASSPWCRPGRTRAKASASQAGRGVALADAVGEAPAHPAQDPVRDRAADARVQGGEPVEVHVHDPDAGAVPVRLRDRDGEPVGDEERAGEPGERVAVDVRARGGPVLVDLAHQELHRGPAAVGDGRRRALDLGRGAVDAAHPRGEPHPRGAGGGRRRRGLRHVQPLVGVQEVAEGPAGHRRRRLQPEQLSQRGVREHDAPGGLDHDGVGQRRRRAARSAPRSRAGRRPPAASRRRRAGRAAGARPPGAARSPRPRAVRRRAGGGGRRGSGAASAAAAGDPRRCPRPCRARTGRRARASRAPRAAGRGARPRRGWRRRSPRRRPRAGRRPPPARRAGGTAGPSGAACPSPRAARWGGGSLRSSGCSQADRGAARGAARRPGSGPGRSPARGPGRSRSRRRRLWNEGSA